MSKKKRIDEILVSRGLFSSIDDAQKAIFAGEIIANDTRAISPSDSFPVDCQIRTKGKGKYVSRGGDKLKAAIDCFDIDVSNKVCLDIGSSTGGFSDCLLQEGAKKVTCVDVNYGQLAWEIRTNPKVEVFERTNIKKVDSKDIGGPFDVVVIDVSFIGLATLADIIANCCHQDSKLIALVKPQFESKRGESISGVVEDESVRVRCLEEVIDSLTKAGFEIIGSVESPLLGPAGNVEFLIYAIFT